MDRARRDIGGKVMSVPVPLSEVVNSVSESMFVVYVSELETVHV